MPTCKYCGNEVSSLTARRNMDDEIDILACGDCWTYYDKYRMFIENNHFPFPKSIKAGDKAWVKVEYDDGTWVWAKAIVDNTTVISINGLEFVRYTCYVENMDKDTDGYDYEYYWEDEIWHRYQDDIDNLQHIEDEIDCSTEIFLLDEKLVTYHCVEDIY